jgi:surface antigen Omp85-like protein
MCPTTARFARFLAVGCAAAAVTAAGAQAPPDAPPAGTPPTATAGPSGSGSPVQPGAAQTEPSRDHAAVGSQTGPKQRDLLDVAQRLLGFTFKPGGDKPKSTQMLILPIIDQNPTNGFIMGIQATGTYRPKDRTTQVSTFTGGIARSSKSQSFAGVEYSFYPAGNRWNLQGEWAYADASLPVYGLGADTPESRANAVDFKLIGIHQNVRRRIGPRLYAGPGYYLDLYDNLAIEQAKPGTNDPFAGYGVGTRGRSVSSGVSMELLLDSRDNPINASRGVYANMSYRVFPKLLGSDQNWQSFLLEGRAYPRFPAHSKNVLALRAFGWFTLSGQPPYLELPAVATPLSFAGRGYTIGRYRGKHALYGEAEYRFGITRDGFLGGVAFTNLSSVSEPGSNQFEHLIPAVGAGLRVKFDKSTGSNLRIDYARGKAGSDGWYIGVDEAF